MMSAPALLKHVSVSKTTSFSLSHPLSDAALIIAYSPLTWYAAIGRLVLSFSLLITSN